MIILSTFDLLAKTYFNNKYKLDENLKSLLDVTSSISYKYLLNILFVLFCSCNMTTEHGNSMIWRYRTYNINIFF